MPPVEPVVEPTPSTPGRAPSFVAIQQLQLDQGVGTIPDKRSLREIQEEEQSRQAEDDFLKWWAAEEERVRLEEAQMASILENVGERKASKPKASKKKSGSRKPPSTTAEGTSENHIRPEGQGRQNSRRNAKKPPRSKVEPVS